MPFKCCVIFIHFVLKFCTGGFANYNTLQPPAFTQHNVSRYIRLVPGRIRAIHHINLNPVTDI